MQYTPQNEAIEGNISRNMFPLVNETALTNNGKSNVWLNTSLGLNGQNPISCTFFIPN